MSNKNSIEELKNRINAALKTKALQTFDEDDDLTIPRFGTGVIPIDKILGKGSNGFGFPIGRVIEIYGPEAAGKTTVVLATIAETQRTGGVVAFIDAEHALNLEYAEKMGVVVEELLVNNPDTSEEAFNVAEMLAESGSVQLIVIDSIAALAPIHMAESNYEDKFMDSGAKLNATFMRRVTPILKKNNCSIIIINQMREKIGVMYGNPETTNGGRALRHAYSVRLEVRRGEVLKRDGEDYGHMVKCKTVKNKTSAPQKVTEAKLIWGIGFDKNYCLLKECLEKGIVKKGGAWYSYGDQKWQGEERTLEAFESNDDLRLELEEAVKNAS